MASLIVETLPLKDEDALQAIRSVAEQLPPTGLKTLHWTILDDNDNTSCRLDAADSNPSLRAILDANGELFRSLWVEFNVAQAHQNVNGLIRLKRDQAGSPTISLNIPDIWGAQSAERTKVVIAFGKAFERYKRSSILGSVDPLLAEFYRRRDEAVLHLEDAYSNLIRKASEHRQELDRELATGKQNSETEYTARREQLDTEYKEKVDQLATREQALDERAKLLDDKDNTHARRQLQKELKTALRERNTSFALTRETERKRWPVIVAFAVLIAALLAALTFAFYGTTIALPAGVPFWFPLTRLGLSLLALAGAIIFYIRWQDRWSDLHAAEEFRLKRLDLDVDRASWLVEVMLEWRGEAGADIPKELIEKLANGLFDQTTSSPLATHPIEDSLATLLASPAAIKLDLPGGSLSLDRKSVKDLQKHA
jgi:hypothetical protein